MTRTILLTAGGTGGHLFPAQALAGELQRRGHVVELATDERADKYGAAFPARKVHLIASETLRGRSPVNLAKTAISLAKGTLQARAVLKNLKPEVVVGFGGYPTFPPMFAARLTRTPSILHESNAVMGRANKMLAGSVSALATSLPLVNADPELEARTVETGNPVRDAVMDVAGSAYPVLNETGPIHLLVFGGSQGARFFSDCVPSALGQLPLALKSRIHLVQQCRAEDLERVRAAYQACGVEANLHTFFQDMPARISNAHLVISRSGASTLSELTVIGRPSILVPLPGAIDQDQLANAQGLAKVGGAWPVAQKDLTPERLCEDLVHLFDSPNILKTAADAALSQGKPDAVKRLADLVERVAAGEAIVEGTHS
ncbi:undecaprenyldiphospho-muramoylpentapeptide beta-N-acetylglucosaminyltransferase [Roseibium sp. CAU 1637]|uniref:UDP-N-acetylglucosamine--N-acetylmuramyl-(pentapeptide) pyrophosphoryl-undecaprenol N-acetylglucosamine transferase n=1 Tax=Roseibium limicola TaxID=2816037 RepID=A0A939EKX6_9HYPH|nr:undecaprenyldiphospho-muramoylpentapeptide beta-N-acetylglucosaminyltransferase [Roseibium limicola]MBO0343697.1 undecaprenyldiphospho-muramoylpentapeptide beta-N-acetylglucosaminyltransferase [Roseibium limicola]